jgi:hypothetical protein
MSERGTEQERQMNMAQAIITPEEQIENLKDVAGEAYRCLWNCWRKTLSQARKDIRVARSMARSVRNRRYPWLTAAEAAVAAVDHLRLAKDLYLAGLLEPIQDDGLPF